MIISISIIALTKHSALVIIVNRVLSYLLTNKNDRACVWAFFDKSVNNSWHNAIGRGVIRLRLWITVISVIIYAQVVISGY